SRTPRPAGRSGPRSRTRNRPRRSGWGSDPRFRRWWGRTLRCWTANPPAASPGPGRVRGTSLAFPVEAVGAGFLLRPALRYALDAVDVVPQRAGARQHRLVVTFRHGGRSRHVPQVVARIAHHQHLAIVLRQPADLVLR